MDDFSETRVVGAAERMGAVPAKRTCLLVLGMHRSGTSALTRVLNLLGAALPKTLMGAGKGNETGHWESERLVAYHDTLLAELGSRWDDWQPLDLSRLTAKRRAEVRAEIAALLAAEYGDAPLIVVKDPRICRFVPLFLEALDDAGFTTRVVLTIRNPLEVTASLAARDGMRRGQGGLLWLRHVLAAEAATRDVPRAILAYDRLLAEWRRTLQSVTALPDLELPYAADDVADDVALFLTPHQRHYVHSSEEVLLDPALRDWVGAAHGALRVMAQNPAAEPALATLDRIRVEFDHAAPVIARLEAEIEGEKALALEAGREARATRERELKSTRSRVVELERALEAERETRATREGELRSTRSRVAELERALEAEREALATRERELQSIRSRMTELERALEEKTEVLEAERQARTVEVQRVAERVHEIAMLRQKLAQTQQRLAQAEQRNEAYRNSTSWKVTRPFRALKLGQKRAVGSINRGTSRVKGAARAILAASRIGGGVLPTTRRAISVWRREGMAGVKERLRCAQSDTSNNRL